MSFSSCAQSPFGSHYLKLDKTIPLPNVRGRIDHLAADAKLHRFYVAALGNNTVEVVDADGGRVVHTITGVHEPQGVEYLSNSNSIFVANGATGAGDFFDASNFNKKASLDFKNDADDVRYLADAKLVFVGYGEGGIAIINEELMKHQSSIAFSGHPEGFQVDGKSRKIWVNVPDSRMIAVLDGNTLQVKDQWKIQSLSSNFPMAYDSLHHRLFVGFRSPARMAIFDSETGKQLAALPCVGDTDDLFYDAATKTIIVSGGEGYIDIFKQNSDNDYSPIAHISSRKGARTSLLVSSLREFVLAVPARNGQPAELRIYKLM